MSYQSHYPRQYPPSFDNDEYQRRQDAEHLNLLTICHYIMAGLVGLGALGVAVYFFFFAAIIGTVPDRPGQEMPAAMAGIFAIIGVISFLFTAGSAALTAYAGRCLQLRKSPVLIYVAAALNCLNAPVGTILGVFTFVVMNRPTVKELFDPSAMIPEEETSRYTDNMRNPWDPGR